MRPERDWFFKGLIGPNLGHCDPTDYNSRQLIEAGVITGNMTQAVAVSCGRLSARDS